MSFAKITDAFRSWGETASDREAADSKKRAEILALIKSTIGWDPPKEVVPGFPDKVVYQAGGHLIVFSEEEMVIVPRSS